jgi:transcriptional regulator with PAS, ATPase and Fis domain
MVEAELFGSVRGAFTDSKKDRAGILASAQGGTLLLDEITEFRIDLQPKLLRVLEERRFFPVGSDRDRPVDLRVLAATNRDPERAVAEGRMRADLFYRLATVIIEVPPLRQREDDLLPLAEYFLAWFAAEFGRGVMQLSPDAVMAIYSHHWPGNVRELRNVIERAVIACDGHSVTAKHLGIVSAPPKPLVRAPTPLVVSLPHHPRIPTATVPVVPAAPLMPTGAGAASGGTPSVLPGRSSLMPGISLAPPSGPPVRLEEARAKALETVERKQIEKAMRVARGNRTAAAEILGISRSTLWEKLKQYGLLDK